MEFIGDDLRKVFLEEISKKEQIERKKMLDSLKVTETFLRTVTERLIGSDYRILDIPTVLNDCRYNRYYSAGMLGLGKNLEKLQKLQDMCISIGISLDIRMPSRENSEISISAISQTNILIKGDICSLSYFPYFQIS